MPNLVKMTVRSNMLLITVHGTSITCVYITVDIAACV